MTPIKKNQQTAALIQELKKLSMEKESKLWKRLAQDLEKPSRQRRIVNIYKIDASTGKDETVVVPGKVLGVGELSHAVTVAALSFSEEAREKIVAKGAAMSIQELMKKNPKGSNIRILG